MTQLPPVLVYKMFKCYLACTPPSNAGVGTYHDKYAFHTHTHKHTRNLSLSCLVPFQTIENLISFNAVIGQYYLPSHSPSYQPVRPPSPFTAFTSSIRLCLVCQHKNLETLSDGLSESHTISLCGYSKAIICNNMQ